MSERSGCGLGHDCPAVRPARPDGVRFRYSGPCRHRTSPPPPSTPLIGAKRVQSLLHHAWNKPRKAEMDAVRPAGTEHGWDKGPGVPTISGEQGTINRYRWPI